MNTLSTWPMSSLLISSNEMKTCLVERQYFYFLPVKINQQCKLYFKGFYYVFCLQDLFAALTQLYGHLPPITKTIKDRRIRHAEHCWRSRDKLISDVLLWTPSYGRAKAGRPARTYIQQLCEDTRCSPEDLPEAMNDREECRERVRDIRADCTT